MTSTRRYSFFILTLLVAGLCLRLAFWQLSRLGERRDRNSDIAFHLDQPPLQLDTVGLDANLVYRRIIARGVFDPEHQVLLRNRALEGRPGFHLVTPLRLEGSNQAILVDRGWISMADAEAEAIDRYRTDEEVTLIGIGLPSQEQPSWRLLADPTPAPNEPARQKWRLLDLSLIAPQIPYPLLPFYLGVTERPEASADQPTPDQEIDLSDGPHLGYALQWFALAAIALGGGVYWLTRSRQNGA